MKNKLLFGTLGFLITTAAHAYLPASAITTMALPVYGIYTSADPTCQTGLVPTVALASTPHVVNFAANAAIGSGPVSATIACVIIVTGNNLSNGWAAGNYVTSSASGGGSSYPDSNCNAGGNNTGQTICNDAAAPTWPARITADATALGLTLKTSSCSSTANNEIVPLVLSTNSICTGQVAADSSVVACAGGNMSNWSLPTSSADPLHGTKLTAPSTSGNLKFVVNPANTLGGQDNSGSCGNIAAPLFSFQAI